MFENFNNFFELCILPPVAFAADASGRAKRWTGFLVHYQNLKTVKINSIK